MKVTIAITGASGSIYAARMMVKLCADDKVDKIVVVFSTAGRKVFDFERAEIPTHDKIEIIANDNLFVPIASGSANADAMVVIPCSMGTMARIAGGVSSNLIERAADVQLKERAKLVIVARETPLSLIHLRAMTTLTQAGAVILPACPSFYTQPQNVNDVVDSVVDRVLKIITPWAQTPKFESPTSL